MKLRFDRETVWSPTFAHEIWTREVLEDCFEKLFRVRVATESPVGIEFRKKRTTAALLTGRVLKLHVGRKWPLLFVHGLCFAVRPAISSDMVRIHGLSPSSVDHVPAVGCGVRILRTQRKPTSGCPFPTSRPSRCQADQSGPFPFTTRKLPFGTFFGPGQL